MKPSTLRLARNLSTPTAFTPLESRMLLSGNVTASISGGNLTITGDRAANAITLDQTGLKAGQVRLAGAGSTTINGKASVVIDNATRGVRIMLGDGADSVIARGLSFSEDFTVDDVKGSGSASLSGMKVGGNLTVRNMSGHNAVVMNAGTVGKSLKITSEAGGQTVDLRTMDVAANTRVLSGGKAATAITIDQSHLRGNVELRTGQSTDVVRIDTRGGPGSAPTDIEGSTVISLNGGHDVLELGTAGQTRNRPTFGSSGRYDGGPGLDAVYNHDVTGSTGKHFTYRNFESGVPVTPGADKTAPTVTATDPASRATAVARNKKIAATFSEAMNASTLTSSTVSLKAGKTSVAGTVAFAGRTMTFAPSTRLAANTTYRVTISTGAKDVAGNALAKEFSWTFKTGRTSDTTAPTVTATDPADLATNVAINKKIAATFSEAMDPLTLTTANITVKDGSTNVAGSIAYVGTTMTFTPASSLAANTTYTAKITTGAKDLAGNAMASNVTWSFTTGSTVDAIAPTVTSTNPAANKTNVMLNKTIAATFSESMDAVSVNTSYTLEGPGNAAVTGSVNYDALSKTVTFTPLANLAPNTLYTATISGGNGGASDLAGNPLAVDKVWSFTTGSQIAQAPIVLGRAAPFAILATSAVSGSANDITGDVGLNPGSAQGIAPSEIHGNIEVTNQTVINAQTDLLAAYNDAVSRTVTSKTLPGNLGGLTFTPGLYTNSSSVQISGVGPANNVTLDAQGDADAIFIFKMSTTLTTGPAAHVILAGGAKASNVFWQVGSSATLDTTTIFKGNILASVSITVNNGSDVLGRLLAGSNSAGAVTVNGSTVTVPA